MDEWRELRVYMLGVGIVACVLRISIVIYEHVDFGSLMRCAEDALIDLHLL